MAKGIFGGFGFRNKRDNESPPEKKGGSSGFGSGGGDSGFNSQLQKLTQESRVGEALNLIKRTLAAKCDPLTEFYLLYNKAELLHMYAGNGSAAAEAYEEALAFADAQTELMSGTEGSGHGLFRDMYAAARDRQAELATSAQEYLGAMNRSAAAIPLTDLQTGQISLIETKRDEGQDWTAEMLVLAERYTEAGKCAQAAAIYSRIWDARKQLRPTRDQIAISCNNYGVAMVTLMKEYAETCLSQGRKLDTENYYCISAPAMRMLRAMRTETKNQAIDENIKGLMTLHSLLLNDRIVTQLMRWEPMYGTLGFGAVRMEMLAAIENPDTESDELFALYVSLGELLHQFAGDGVGAMDAFEKAWDVIQSHPEVLDGEGKQGRIDALMKKIQSDLCEYASGLAVSYEEYNQWVKRRPDAGAPKDELILEQERKGTSYLRVMATLAEQCKSKRAWAGAAAIYSRVLDCRTELGLPIDDLARIGSAYTISMGLLLEEYDTMAMRMGRSFPTRGSGFIAKACVERLRALTEETGQQELLNQIDVIEQYM